MNTISSRIKMFCVSTMLLSTSVVASAHNHNITAADVQAAQDAWGKALIQISTDHASGGIEKATATAKQVLDHAYGYNLGPVLFKPTLTNGETTFRTSYEGALAYFVGGNSKFTDKGFALKGWTHYRYKNAGVQFHGDLALTMGHVFLTDKQGTTTVVDKTWGFRKGDDGKVRIVLHHSSLPYSAN